MTQPTATILQPNERLLLASARAIPSAESLSIIHELTSSSDVDWLRLPLQSVRHGVAQSISLHLRRCSPGRAVPPAVTQFFRRAYRGNSNRVKVLLDQALRASAELSAAGIRAVALKGAALAVTAYPWAAVRNFSDIDLLVEEADFEAACAVLGIAGFNRQSVPDEDNKLEAILTTSASADILSDTVPIGFEPDLTPDIVRPYSRLVTIEVHRGLFRDSIGRRRRADLSEVWSGARQIRVNGSPLMIPDPAAMLVHLCAHAGEHAFDRLLYFMDIALVCTLYEKQLDWTRVECLSQLWGVDTHVRAAVDLAAREFEAPLPADALAFVGRPGFKLQVEDVLRAEYDLSALSRLRRWKLAPGGASKLTAALRAVYPPVSVMRSVHGTDRPLLLAMHYGLRPIRLARRLLRISDAVKKSNIHETNRTAT